MAKMRRRASKEPPTRDNLPCGMTVARWDALKEMILIVLWRVGMRVHPVSYKVLCLMLEGLPLYHRSSTLTGLLNEIARDEIERGAPCYVTAIVALAGKKYSGAGFFKMVQEDGWMWTSKTEFCEEQRRLARTWIRRNLREPAAVAA